MMSIPSHIWPMSSPESSTVIRTAKSISSCRGLTESKTSRQWPENDAYRTPNNSGPPLQQAPLLDKTGTALEDLPVSVQIIKCEVVTEQAGTLPNELTNSLTTCSVRIVVTIRRVPRETELAMFKRDGTILRILACQSLGRG
jgi:hypothetical protein